MTVVSYANNLIGRYTLIETQKDIIPCEGNRNTLYLDIIHRCPIRVGNGDGIICNSVGECQIRIVV